MAQGLRALQQWNQWLAHSHMGKSLLRAEKRKLEHLLQSHFGKHVLLMGVSNQSQLLNATSIHCQTLLTPLASHDKKQDYIESYLTELPILTSSVDLVILPHTLEFIDNPRQVLSEACRVIKPEGLIALCGFNPYSLWGIRKWIARSKHMPWSANFIQAQRIKSWLKLADFDIEKQTSFLFQLPFERAIYSKLTLLDKIGQTILPLCGGVYVLIARAKVMPLTPIRLKWKQQLSNIRISTTIPGHIARHTE